jgi:hypothetical protein
VAAPDSPRPRPRPPRQQAPRGHLDPCQSRKLAPCRSMTKIQGGGRCTSLVPRRPRRWPFGVGEWRIRSGPQTSHSGYCSATSMAQAPEPDPQSRIRRGRGMGGNMSLWSNIMLKMWCMYWRRSISSWPTIRHRSRRQEADKAGPSLHRQQEQSIFRFPRHIAETLCCRVRRPLDMCYRREPFGNRYVRLSESVCMGCRVEIQSLGNTLFVHGRP